MPNGLYFPFLDKMHVVPNSIRTVMSNHTTEDELNAFMCHLIQTQMLYEKKKKPGSQRDQQTPRPTSSWRQEGKAPPQKTTHHKHIFFIKQNVSPSSTLSPEPKQKCLSLLFGSKSPDTSACLLTSTATRRRERGGGGWGREGRRGGGEGGRGEKNQSNTAELSDHMKLWILGLSIQPLSAELCKSIQTDTKSKHTLNATIGNWSERSLPF